MDLTRINLLMLNVVTLLWVFAGYVWAVNSDIIFATKQQCAVAIYEYASAHRGMTEIPTPRSCRKFSREELQDIVAGIDWGIKSSPPPVVEESPSPIPTTMKPRRTPRPTRSPTPVMPSPTSAPPTAYSSGPPVTWSPEPVPTPTPSPVDITKSPGVG